MIWLTAPDTDHNAFFFFFYLSVACDTIVGAVNFQFLMASKVWFVFSFAKSDIVDNAIAACEMHVCSCVSGNLVAIERFWLLYEVEKRFSVVF